MSLCVSVGKNPLKNGGGRRGLAAASRILPETGFSGIALFSKRVGDCLIEYSQNGCHGGLAVAAR